MRKFLVLSSWSRKAIGSMLIMAFTFVGCDDSSSASAGPNDEPGVESSSSSGKVTEPAEETSSSSEMAKSSSSNAQSEVKQSSSSEKTGKSSSSVDDASSSSVKSELSEKSSSSEKHSVSSSSSVDVLSSSSESTPNSGSSQVPSSSSAGKVNCSALLEGEMGWSWNVPKECRFNPDITYGSMTDERDGKAYKTVKIGNQIWMAENLNYYDESNLSVKTQSWCYGKSDNKDSSTCDVAGRLYTWAAAIDSAKLYTEKSLDCGYDKTCALPDTVYGICSPGWHLPSKTEWETLLTAVGGKSTAGKILKSQNGWENNGNGSDAFGFSALPAGSRSYKKGNFKYDGSDTDFWSATENGEPYAYEMRLSDGSRDACPACPLDGSVCQCVLGEDASLYDSGKRSAYSVRCVKD